MTNFYTYPYIFRKFQLKYLQKILYRDKRLVYLILTKHLKITMEPLPPYRLIVNHDKTIFPIDNNPISNGMIDNYNRRNHPLNNLLHFIAFVETVDLKLIVKIVCVLLFTLDNGNKLSPVNNI